MSTTNTTKERQDTTSLLYLTHVRPLILSHLLSKEFRLNLEIFSHALKWAFNQSLGLKTSATVETQTDRARQVYSL